MKEQILENIENPGQLEALYRTNKTNFRSAFNSIYAEVKENTTAQVWYERLNFEQNELSWGTSKELVFIITASLLAGTIAKIPDLFGINPEYFYPRNIGLVVFPLLSAYFVWKQKADSTRTAILLLAFLLAAIYINLLPANVNSDTLILACIHLPMFLWALLGLAFIGDKIDVPQKRLDFLRYNGDLLVMTAIILLAGGLLAGITIGLFSLIGIPMEELYFRYVGIWGLSAAPLMGTYLVQTNPHLVNKVSPVIAKVFTPLVLATLIAYLTAIIYTGKDPYNDREFLLIFNLLLVAVMALILFSVAETPRNGGSKTGLLLLLSLAIVTIVLNGIALSAIIFRISEWGITPNRLAVLGGNILILTNLMLVTFRLFKSLKDQNGMTHVERSIAIFLPVYTLWVMIVTFLFPLLFNFK